ncbi:MAG: CPBP family glutamic-type intramembrane protease [Hyphomicrobiaceae bacterium]
MSDRLRGPDDSERFQWIERRDDDFPYYRGHPVAIENRAWMLVMAAVAIGFAILVFLPVLMRGPALSWIPVILFAAIPLGALAYVAPKGWTAIFRPLRGKDYVLMGAFAFLNILVTFAMGAIIVALTETTNNAAVTGLADQTALERTMFFARSIPQLFGEELFTILPFLALLSAFAQSGLARKSSIVLAALIVAVFFAAAHLQTYGFNVIQALAGVGVARLVLLVPYIVTKNIWVSTGTHILNDWFTFGLSILGASLAS